MNTTISLLLLLQILAGLVLAFLWFAVAYIANAFLEGHVMARQSNH